MFLLGSEAGDPGVVHQVDSSFDLGQLLEGLNRSRGGASQGSGAGQRADDKSDPEYFSGMHSAILHRFCTRVPLSSSHKNSCGSIKRVVFHFLFHI